MPRVSVVVPAYNSARYITATLRSVLAQTTAPDEVVVVDDGSTDGTGDIARTFGAPIRVIRTANSGLSATRNTGTREATGDWIAFLDADDLWEPTKLEAQMAELQQAPDADVCYTGRIEFTEIDGQIVLGDVSLAAPATSIREALFKNTNFLSSSVIIRRSRLIDIGGFSTHTKVEDWDLWLRLLHAGARFVSRPEPLFLYRVHPDSLTHNAIALLEGKEEIYRRLVLPHLPPWQRGVRRNQQTSEHQSCAAYILRKAHDPGWIPLMTKSIVRGPFYEPKRYLVLAHGLVTGRHSQA